MRRSRIIVAVVLILLGALLLGSWLTDRLKEERSDRTIVLPNGTRAKVLGAVRGGTTFSTEEAWSRPLRKILPGSWQSWLPSVVSITCGSTNDIVVYFSLAAPGGAISYPWSWPGTEDDDGFRYPPTGGSCSTSTGGTSVYGVVIRSFPRRQKFFRLNFLDSNYQIITRVKVANPLPVPPPEQKWQAEAMPITRTNGPLALTLASAREETNQWGTYLRPKWQTQALDSRWKNTQPGYLQVADAVGNEGGFLSRKEKVWQGNANFHRKRREDFEAYEIMVVTNLSVPAPGEMISAGAVQDCADVQVQLEGLFGAGTLYITNGLQRIMTTNVHDGWSTSSDGKTTVESIGSKENFFLVNATGMAAHDELRLRLTDEAGRNIPLKQSNTYQSHAGSSARVYQRSFVITNQVQSLSLEIIVSHPQEFIFYINPKEILPPEPKPAVER